MTAKMQGELSAGLRKLLEAKDCFVRAKLAEKPAAIPASEPEPATETAARPPTT